ncbi:MAG: cbb3-type cytochrome c oxidase subunit I, partial [Planctomycetota bacterium]
MTRQSSAAASFDGSKLPGTSDLVEVRLVHWYFAASLTYMLIAMLAGALFSMLFFQHYPLGGIELASPGRWRMIHTNGVAYGFIANAFLGGLHWAVPRLTLRPVLSRKLSWFIFFAWQAILVATVIGLMTGHAQAVEWGETPRFVDPVALLGLVLVAVNFLVPILKTSGPMYVTLWYFIAAFVWTVLVYAMGNFLPEYLYGGTASGALIGLFIHDLVGLFVTPIGWGLMYYFVPIILKKPIWSHGLSLVGFWGLAFFYPLNGIHHFLYSPIPMFLQYGAVISTIAVELVVTTVIINFFGTIRRKGDLLRTSLPIRWFYVGMVFYFIVCLQCAFQVTLTFQRIIHFTDWVVGHS